MQPIGADLTTLISRVVAAFERRESDPGYQELQSQRDQQERHRQRQATEYSAQARRSQLAERGIPAKDIECIVTDSMTPTQPLCAARDFLANPTARMLVLSGAKGCGKTSAAAWVIAQDCPDSQRSISLHDRAPRFIDVSKLGRVSRYDEAAMSPLETCSMLAIDDLGMEYTDAKGSFLATLDGLINARYSDQLRTVISTNLTASDFKSRYGERIADRIRESGTFVECSGPSLRGKGA